MTKHNVKLYHNLETYVKLNEGHSLDEVENGAIEAMNELIEYLNQNDQNYIEKEPNK